MLCLCNSVFKNHYYNIYKLQEKLCTPNGVSCYRKLEPNYENCILPCKGLYADVQFSTKNEDTDENYTLEKLTKDYALFKERFLQEDLFTKYMFTGIRLN